MQTGFVTDESDFAQESAHTIRYTMFDFNVKEKLRLFTSDGHKIHFHSIFENQARRIVLHNLELKTEEEKFNMITMMAVKKCEEPFEKLKHCLIDDSERASDRRNSHETDLRYLREFEQRFAIADNDAEIKIMSKGTEFELLCRHYSKIR